MSRAGDCIDGRYLLQTEIGAGGLGSVYRATQTKLSREVAVKLLHESMGASEVQRARFEREAKALATLEHPNIVSILDYGVAEGQPYIVMELLEGETLAERLRRATLSPEQVVEITVELLDALAFMHEAGVVHRDLKASNVFLQRVHTGERVKVLDFGLAKTTSTLDTDATTTLTRDGSVVGTPAYMSPEQATGDVVDARSDVYAVGVLLFQMLSGRLPFEGDAIDQVRSHLVEPVPALIRATPSLQMDAAFEKLIRRAMAKRREERFANARAMLLELQRIVNGSSTLPPPAASRQPTLRGPRSITTALSGAARTFAVVSTIVVLFEVALLLLLARDAGDRALLSSLSARILVRLADVRSKPEAVGLGGMGEEEPVDARELAPHDPTQANAPAGSTDTRDAPGLVGLHGETLSALELPLDTPAEGAITQTTQGAAGSAGALADDASDPPHDPPQAGTLGHAGLEVGGAPAPSAQAGVASESPPAPRASFDPRVPGPPPLRNPWARGIPAELRGIRKAVLGGGVGDERTAVMLRAYNQAHPGDPRGHLLLARMYMNRNWSKDAVAQYASALREDLSARGAPEVLETLLDVVAAGKTAHAAAANLIVRAYGSEALSRLDRQLKRSPGADATTRLRALRARLAKAATHPDG